MQKMVKQKKAKASLPKALLNGDEIMKLLKTKPGKEIGVLKEKLREAQLLGKIKDKKQARKYLVTSDK